MGNLIKHLQLGLKKSSIGNIIDTISGNRILFYAMISVFMLPLFLLRDFTINNELRYVSIVREAVNNGNLMTFYNQGNIYADKPPLYLWLMMLGNMFFGKHLLLFMGIVNIMIYFTIINIMNKWCAPFLDQSSRLAASLSLLTTGLFLGSVLIMRMDLLMTFFIVLSLYTFYRIYTGEASSSAKYLFPVYLFLGVFTKGPFAVMIPILSSVLFLISEKKIKTIRRYFGLTTWTIFFSLSALWALLVYIEGGTEYLFNIMFKQTIDRGVNSFHHKEPFWYYAANIGLTVLPWTLLLIAVYIKAIIKRCFIKDPLTRFFFIIIASSFIMLSAVSSKINIYMLPIYPFLIYFGFVLLKKVKPDYFIYSGAAFPSAMLLIAIIGFFFFKDKIKYDLPPLTWLIPVFSIFAAFCIASIMVVFKKNIIRGINIFCLGILFTFFLVSLKVVDYNYLVGLGEVSELAAQISTENNINTIATYKMGRSENMDVYLNRDIVKLHESQELDDPLVIAKPYVLITKEKEFMKIEKYAAAYENTVMKRSGRYIVLIME